MFVMLVSINFQATSYESVFMGLKGFIDSVLNYLNLLLILQFSFVVAINVLFSTFTNFSFGIGLLDVSVFLGLRRHMDLWCVT